MVGSFSSIGYDVRSRLEHWAAPSPRAGATALVTGATSGLGFACARRLAALGLSVRIVGRDANRTREATEQINQLSGNDDVEGFAADMSDLDSVRELARWVQESTGTLDVLVHNAGSISATRTLTPQGFETSVAAQLLGPYLLNELLLTALAQGIVGRVLTVSSGGMYTQRFDLDTLVSPGGEYDGVATYARVKRAQVVLNRAWATRVERRSTVFHAMHPGWVDTPGIRSSLPTFYGRMRPLLRTPEQGSDTMEWLATAGDPVTSTGDFWFDRRRRRENKIWWTRPRDPRRDEAQLWTWCAEQVSSN